MSCPCCPGVRWSSTCRGAARWTSRPLAELLATGQLGGAGLDTFGTEPLPADSPLLDAPNTLLSPHCAGYSARAAWRLDIWTVGDAVEWLRTGQLRHGAVVVAGTR